MNKVRYLMLPILLSGLLAAPAAQANLYARSQGGVYDSDQDLTWLQDANYAATQAGGDGLMDWATANDWANNLVFAGSSGWRLPTADEACDYTQDCTTSELGHLFYLGLGGTRDTPIGSSHSADYGLFLNIQDTGYWTQTAFSQDSGFAWNFDNLDGTQLPYNKNNLFYGWAVHVGDVMSVPEPGSLLLAAAGGCGWLGVAVRRKAHAAWR